MRGRGREQHPVPRGPAGGMADDEAEAPGVVRARRGDGVPSPAPLALELQAPVTGGRRDASGQPRNVARRDHALGESRGDPRRDQEGDGPRRRAAERGVAGKDEPVPGVGLGRDAEARRAPADVVACAIGVPPERSASATTCPGAPTPAGRSSVPVMVAAVPAVIVRRLIAARRVAAPCLASVTCWAPLGPRRVRVAAVPAAAGAAETVKMQLEPAATVHVAGVTDHPSAPADSVAAMLMFSPDTETVTGAVVAAGAKCSDAGETAKGRVAAIVAQVGASGASAWPGAVCRSPPTNSSVWEAPNWPCASAAPMTAGASNGHRMSWRWPQQPASPGDVQSSLFEPKPSSYIHTKSASRRRAVAALPVGGGSVAVELSRLGVSVVLRARERVLVQRARQADDRHQAAVDALEVGQDEQLLGHRQGAEVSGSCIGPTPSAARAALRSASAAVSQAAASELAWQAWSVAWLSVRLAGGSPVAAPAAAGTSKARPQPRATRRRTSIGRDHTDRRGRR